MRRSARARSMPHPCPTNHLTARAPACPLACKALSGWAAWGLFLQMLIRASSGAPGGPAALWGWSFWVYTAAVVAATLSGTALCCA
jgi:hypothetical protein